MSLCKYVREIESLEFQIQFSVIGGIEILQLAMERHPTLIALRSEIMQSEDLADTVFRRILQLLGKVETEMNLSYDESIAAYLFSLFKEKPILAYRASWRILDFGGLWWSVQLAHHVKDMTRQIFDSVDVTDSESETVAFGSIELEGLAENQELSLDFASRNISEALLWSTDLTLASFTPGRLAVYSSVRDALKSQKSFEISDASNRKRYFEMTR